MKKWIIVLVVVVVIAAVAAYFFGPFRGQSQAASGDMQTVPAEIGDLTATIGATGVVRADQTAILPWQTSGTVDIVNILIGETVTKGQVLAILEQTSLPQNVILAQADLDGRYIVLSENKANTKHDDKDRFLNRIDLGIMDGKDLIDSLENITAKDN